MVRVRENNILKEKHYEEKIVNAFNLAEGQSIFNVTYLVLLLEIDQGVFNFFWLQEMQRNQQYHSMKAVLVSICEETQEA